MFIIDNEYLIKNRPLSEKVKSNMIKYIKSMDLEKSKKLPDEYTLSTLFGVSRITIRTVLNELATEGKIFRQKGRGTFVNVEAMQMNVTFNPAVEFEDMISNSGYDPYVEIVGSSIIPPSAKLRSKLKLGADDHLMVIERMYYADGNPAALCIDYFPKKYLIEELKEEEYSMSIFKIINIKCKKKIIWDKVELSTVSIGEDSKLSKYFKTNNPEKSLLLCDAINYDESNKAVLFAEEYIDTKYIRFNVIRQKELNYQ